MTWVELAPSCWRLWSHPSGILLEEAWSRSSSEPTMLAPRKRRTHSPATAALAGGKGGKGGKWWEMVEKGEWGWDFPWIFGCCSHSINFSLTYHIYIYKSLYIYIYMSIYIYVYIHTHTYIYIVYIYMCVFYQFQTEVSSSWQIIFHVFMVRGYSSLGLVSGHNSNRKTRSSTRVPIISSSDAKSGTYR